MSSQIFVAFALIFILCAQANSHQINYINQEEDIQTLPRKIYVSNTKSVSLRLKPNEDIMTSITALLSSHKFTALSIVSAVGSINYCWIRFANQSTFTKISGPMQITSLSGTLDKNLSPHIHISVASQNGTSYGGHLPSLQQRQQAFNTHEGNILSDGFYCPILTTLQLVLLSHQDIIYERKIDAETTFHQLTIRKKHFWG